MTEILTYDESDLLCFTQRVAIYLTKRYVCADCYHKKGIATYLHLVQKPAGENFDRFAVYCTECGQNVASRDVGRITLWFLTHQGQKYIERALEIKEYARRMEVEREKLAGTYQFDEQQALKDLGF